MDELDPNSHMLDFFPSYEPYGLREIATTDDPILLLRWITAVTARSFDSLAVAKRSTFARLAWEYLGDAEHRGVWNRTQDLLDQHPHDHPDDIGRAEVTTVIALNQLLDGVLRLRPDAETLAELADTLHHGAALLIRLHDRADGSLA